MVFGNTFPKDCANLLASTQPAPDDLADLTLRLRLGSHLARHLRHELEHRNGYTATVGISTNKQLSKLVGNVNKPMRQTTLVPPYNFNIHGESNVHAFIDAHDIGKLPGVGFKTAQKLRAYLIGRSPEFDAGLVYGGTRENVAVKAVRQLPQMGPSLLMRILQSPGMPKDLPEKVWDLLNGVDNTEVGRAKEVPQQISIEDSYIRLDELCEVVKKMNMLAISLIKRMRLDLTTGDNAALNTQKLAKAQWIARPTSLRLSTRPRPPLRPDGTRTRCFNRISKSCYMPSFVFDLSNPADALAQRLVEEVIMPLFRKLHPEKSGWNLSLVNLCAANMIIAASDKREGAGRDIGSMFRKQDDVLKEWKVQDGPDPPSQQLHHLDVVIHGTAEPDIDASLAHFKSELTDGGSEDCITFTQSSTSAEDEWDSNDDIASDNAGEACVICKAKMPAFAMFAHQRFHGTPADL